MIPILSRPEQRVKWLTSQNRALTEDEADELYRNLKRIEYRERRIAKLQEEASTALALDREENERLLQKVLREADPPRPPRAAVVKRAKTFEEQMQAVAEGRATVVVMPKSRAAVELTLGGVSSGWAA